MTQEAHTSSKSHHGLHTMPHLPSTHHETSKRDSPNETKIKEKENKPIPDLNSNLTKSMTHHNQTNKLITWFLTIIKKLTKPKNAGRLSLNMFTVVVLFFHILLFKYSILILSLSSIGA
jgi:hypothetical protein